MASAEQLTVKCPHCGQAIRYEVRRGGEQVGCPRCRETLTLPGSRPPTPSPPPVVVTRPSPAATTETARLKTNVAPVAIVASIVAGVMLISCCGGSLALLLTRSERGGDIVEDALPTLPTAGETSTLTEAEREQWREAMLILEDMEAKLAAADPGRPKELLVASMKSGDLGVFRQPIRVAQVLENDETGSFLALVGRSATIVKFSHVDTRDVVDDRYWTPGDRWFYVIGPTQYTTVTGAQKTVMWLMQVQPPKPADPT